MALISCEECSHDAERTNSFLGGMQTCLSLPSWYGVGIINWGEGEGIISQLVFTCMGGRRRIHHLLRCDGFTGLSEVQSPDCSLPFRGF